MSLDDHVHQTIPNTSRSSAIEALVGGSCMAHIVAGKSRHHALLRTTQKMPFMLQFRWPLQTMFWHGGARRRPAKWHKERKNGRHQIGRNRHVHSWLAGSHC